MNCNTQLLVLTSVFMCILPYGHFFMGRLKPKTFQCLRSTEKNFWADTKVAKVKCNSKICSTTRFLMKDNSVVTRKNCWKSEYPETQCTEMNNRSLSFKEQLVEKYFEPTDGNCTLCRSKLCNDENYKKGDDNEGSNANRTNPSLHLIILSVFILSFFHLLSSFIWMFRKHKISSSVLD